MRPLGDPTPKTTLAGRLAPHGGRGLLVTWRLRGQADKTLVCDTAQSSVGKYHF